MGRTFLIAGHAGLHDALGLLLHEQSDGVLQMVGHAGWQPDQPAAIGPLSPAVVILVVGIEVPQELHALAQVGGLTSQARVLVLDTMGTLSYCSCVPPAAIDALLPIDRVLTDLVPLVRRLMQRVASAG